jgi:hypothetical protein
MLRDEVDLKNAYRHLYCVQFFMSCMIALIGKAGLTSSRFRSSLWCQKRGMRYWFGGLIMLFFSGLFFLHYSKQAKSIEKKFNPPKGYHHAGWGHGHHHGGHRGLKSWFFTGDDESLQYADQDEDEDQDEDQYNDEVEDLVKFVQ